MSELHPIVFDNGSLFMKVGFSGNDIPHEIFPTVTGRQKVSSIIVGLGSIDTYVGDRALNKRGLNIFKYPIQRGLITDMDEMEKVWHHSFYNELRVDPEEHDLLLMVPPLNPKETKEKMSVIMFESFNVKKLCLTNQSAMSLFASGRTTGVVFDSGDGITNTVPVFEGFALSHATFRFELAGNDLTEYLRSILRERGYHFITSEKEIVKDLKEKLSYVSLNFQDEMKESSITKSYELPDGNVIAIGKELFKVPEILFKPNLVGNLEGGIHEQIFISIRKCDLDIRKEMYQNICLSGGSTMFPGMSERLRNELIELSPSSATIRIISEILSDRKVSNWKGGSIFSQLSTFPDMCIFREEYEEIGPTLIHRKFNII